MSVYHLNGGNCCQVTRLAGNLPPALSSLRADDAKTDTDRRHLARAIEIAEQGRGGSAPTRWSGP